MADKKKEKKEIKKTSAPAPEKKSEKKVDIVEEAKKELQRLESKTSTTAHQISETKGFPWGVFIGAALLTSAAFIVGGKINDSMKAKKVEAKLPGIINALAGGMEINKIGKLQDVSGLYQFTLSFKDMEGQEFTSSITKDGKLFFVDSGLKVSELLGETSQETAANTEKVTCENLVKTDAPILSVYVSSDCGYCKQAETKIVSAIKQVPALADSIKIRYAGRVDETGQVISFLGTAESGTENLRQVCLRDEQPAAFWDYLGCMANGGNSDGCLKTTRVDVNKLNSCMKEENRGLAAIKADFAQADAHAIQGTPSFFVNESQNIVDVDFGGRIPDAYKKIICCGSNNQADFCSTTLEDASI